MFGKNFHTKEEYTIVSKKLIGKGVRVISGSSRSKKAGAEIYTTGFDEVTITVLIVTA